jgi:RNA polymerase-binding transcription factor DksA
MKRQRRTAPGKSSASIATREHPLSDTPEPERTTAISYGHEHIPPEWAWHHRTLVQLRERLIRAHAEHATQAATPADMLGVDVVDTAQEQTARDVLWAELGHETDQLFEVDCALQRIGDGTYGICEETGRPIPLERLRAIPWTRYSVAAAQPIEQRSWGMKSIRR